MYVSGRDASSRDCWELFSRFRVAVWLGAGVGGRDDDDLAGGAVEGEGGAGPLVGGRLGHDGPVVDAGGGEGLFGELLGVVERRTGLRVDLFYEPVLDVDDRCGSVCRGREDGHAETFTESLVVGGEHDQGAGVVDTSQQRWHLTGRGDGGVGDGAVRPQLGALLGIQPAGGCDDVDGVEGEVFGTADPGDLAGLTGEVDSGGDGGKG